MQKNQIVRLAHQQEITWHDILQQLKRDLNLSGIDTDFFDQIASFEQLIDDLVVFVEQLLQYHPELFSNLIYRIDISENQIQKIENENLQTTFAELIIKRLIQKVYFRKKYSG